MLLNCLQHREVIFPDESDGLASVADAARAADAVDVFLEIAGHVVVDDVRDLRDIQAARRHVCGDQHLELAGAERAHHRLALVLPHAAVDGLHG